MRMPFLLLLSFFAVFNCSSPTTKIPKYEIFNNEVSDTNSKTLVSLDIGVKEKISEEETKILLNHLYDSIMNTSGYKHRNKPNACRIFVFESKAHFESGVGQWIGNISKARNDSSPQIMTQNFNENLSKENVIENELLKDIELSKQKEIWNELILSERKAELEAEKKYPIKITATNIDKINSQRKLAQKNAIKHYDYNDELILKYRKELINKHKISDSILKALTDKSYKENWPFPAYK